MKLALILGAAGEKTKPRLQNIKDNLKIDCYKSIPTFIDNCMKREFIYDRVLVLSTMLDPNNLADLHKYWDEYSRDTVIVVVCRRGTDEDLASDVLNTFVTSQVAVMLLEKTTVQLMAEGISLSTQELTKKYGISDFLSIETDEGVSFQAEEKEEQEEQKIVQQEEKPKEERKEKKSLLGALFGSGRKKKGNKMPDMQATVTTPQVSAVEETSNVVSFKVDDNSGNTVENVGDEEVQESDTMTSIGDTDFGVKEDITEGVDENVGDDEVQESDTMMGIEGTDFDSSEDVSGGSKEVQESDTMMDIGDVDFDSSEDFDISESSESSDMIGSINTSEDEDIADNDNEDDTSSDISDLVEGMEDDSAEQSVVEEKQDVNHNRGTAVTVEEVDEEDFGSISIPTLSEDREKPKFNYQNKEVVDEDEFIGVGAEESKYRKATEAPKVITKEVIKEVVTGGSSSTLNSILCGRGHKTVVVTGDRGSGVTLTAFNLAKKFSEKVPVLYVDFDTDRHGLLSYIDYNTYLSYDMEEGVMKGISACGSVKAFEHSVCRYDNNLDILTTDYAYDVTDEQIERCQSVIAEIETDYNLVVVDCPNDKLPLIEELLVGGSVVVCTEATKRGIMNMLCNMESINLKQKIKRGISNRGTLVFTKIKTGVKPTDVLSYGSSIFESDGCDWLAMKYDVFNGKFTKSLFSKILE